MTLEKTIPLAGIPRGEIPKNHFTGLDVAAAGRRWIGTAYHHQASLRGVGCDCLGLVRGLWRELVGPEPATMPNYSPAWDEVAKRDDMVSLFRAHLVELGRDRRDAGDVMVFRMRPEAAAKHCGVMTEGGRFLHSQSGRGVVEIELNAWWQRRIVAMFAFPGVGL